MRYAHQTLNLMLSNSTQMAREDYYDGTRSTLKSQLELATPFRVRVIISGCVILIIIIIDIVLGA